jgi:HK97 family phage major capsid protein
MGEYEEFMQEAKAAAKSIRERAEEREIKAQRATVPGLGGGATKEHSLDLTDADRKFLRFVRGQIAPAEMKALVEDGTGQYLVSPTIEQEIERSIAEEVTVRGLASQRTIEKDRIQIRDISEATVAWGRLETGSSPAESDLTPGAPCYKYVCDLYGLVKIGEDELADSDYDLAGILADSFARAIAEKENEGFLVGVGWDSGQQPDGITLDTTLLANAVTTAAAGVIIVEDMLDLVYACPKKYRKNGSFVVNSATELALRKLRAGGSTTTDGPFLWQPSVYAGAPNTFLGRPIYTDDNMETLAGAEQVIAIFGDFRAGYRILDRKGFGIQRLSELYAEAGLVGFKVHARVGGYLIRPANKALVLLKEHA